ncbi:22860_t:CDS:2, partial [Dentiscutata erythropus]
KFIISLGLQEYPSLQTILNLAATNQCLNLREKALLYLVKNLKEKYSITYNPTLIQMKFLPCSNSDNYAKPSECYSDPNCAKMGFNVLHQDWCYWAEQLGVKQHPECWLLIAKLEKDPPGNTDHAKKIFGYLAMRRGYFSHLYWAKLQNIKFIPIQDKVQPERFIHYRPKDCFFKLSNKIYADLFPCVDFDEDANKFLENCGVKQEPTALDLAEYLMSSWKLWSKQDDKDPYISILRTVSYSSELMNSVILEKMKKYPILIGSKKQNNSGKMTESYDLAYAKDIFINDNNRYQEMFKPFTCPFGGLLEEFYQKLGCKSLDASVKVESRHTGKERISKVSKKIQQRIIERLPGYYSSIINGDFKNDETWIQNLEVKKVDKIEMTYELITTHQKETAQVSACISESGNPFILYITNDSDNINYADIAAVLAKHIHRKPDRQSSINLFTYLTSSLEDLRQLGYPTENIKITNNVPGLSVGKPLLPVAGPLFPAAGPVPRNLSNDELENKLNNGIMSCKSNDQKYIPRDETPVIETTVIESHYAIAMDMAISVNTSPHPTNIGDPL